MDTHSMSGGVNPRDNLHAKGRNKQKSQANSFRSDMICRYLHDFHDL